MKLSETETLSYEIFNSKDLDRVADAIGKTFVRFRYDGSRATIVCK
jgi:hypothetical protein